MPRVPAAARVLYRPGVVDAAARRVEVGVAPDGAQRVRAAAERLARGGVDSGAVAGVSGHVVDGLVEAPVVPNPALDDDE